MIYEPREDSHLIERNIQNYVRGKKVLDVGAGSGIQSESALKHGAKSVLSSDIDDDSIKHMKNIGLKTKKSDLFSKINGKFDLIIFNPPYLPEDILEDRESKKITTGGKKGDEIILKFLKQSKNHISNEGIVLLIVSSLTPQKEIKTLIKKLGYVCKVIDNENLFMEKLELWEIKKDIHKL